jgi:hypothetical protein
MQQKYSSTVIADKLIVSVFELPEIGRQRVFRVRFGNKELGDITLDSWRSPSVSLCKDGVLIWGGTRTFRLRLDAAVEQFTFDEEIAAIYPLRHNTILVCELSVRLLGNDFREVNRYSSHEVLDSGWWQGEILYVSGESKQIEFSVEGGLLKSKEMCLPGE